MTRVLFANRAFDHNVGGNSSYVRALVKGLPAEGIDYCSADLRAATGIRSVIEEGILPLTKAVGSAGILHYPTDTGPFARRSRASNRQRIVTTIHGAASLHISGVRSRGAEIAWRTRVRIAARLSDHVITVSSSSADDVIKLTGLSSARISVIPHGIDHSRFHPGVESSTLDPLGLPDRYVLYLGNLDPRKNVESLVSAFQRPQLAASDVPLVIAGRAAWGVDGLVKEMANAKNVHWLGAVDDRQVAPLMAGAAAFVFPSFYEGFGFPVLEAAACGTIVVSTRRGSLRDLAKDVSIDIGDPTPSNIEGTVVSVLGLGEDDRTTLARNALEAVKHFSWDRSFRAHASVFRDLS